MKRQPEQFIALREQGKINAPGINCYRFYAAAMPASSDGKALFNLRADLKHVPPQTAVQFHGNIGKPVRFLEPQPPPVPNAGHHAATLGAQINAEVTSSLHWM